MNSVEGQCYVCEPAKQVPVAYDADVVVAGSGVSGLAAALAAGHGGAKTVLVERFGALGGNLGPGYVIGGGSNIQSEVPGNERLRAPLPGVISELFGRAEQLQLAGANYADMAHTVSYVGMEMAEEYGVELVLSAYAADPILRDQQVQGLFVEGKSGRVAVKAKVVIDATGDASIAARAGAQLIENVSENYRTYGQLENPGLDFAVYNECGLFFFLGGADYSRYLRFVEANEAISAADKEWAQKHIVGPKVAPFPDALTPYVRQAWEQGEFQTVEQLTDPDITISSYGSLEDYGAGLIGARAGIAAGAIDTGDMQQVSLVEARLRLHAFETVQFLRKYIPGFETAYILAVSPFLGARGGPCIIGEHTVTVDEAASGARFDDVLFQCFFRRPKLRSSWVDSGYDVPYRALLPRGLDNILTTGRGAAYVRRGHDGTGMRVRAIAMSLGEAAGTAAALCARDGVSPFQLDRRVLQRELLRQGYNLGSEKRLEELGLNQEK